MISTPSFYERKNEEGDFDFFDEGMCKGRICCCWRRRRIKRVPWLMSNSRDGGFLKIRYVSHGSGVSRRSVHRSDSS